MLEDYIDWSPFFRSWDLHGKFPDILKDEVVGEQASELYKDAQQLLKRIFDEKLLKAKAVFGLFLANSVNDDDIEVTITDCHAELDVEEDLGAESQCPRCDSEGCLRPDIVWFGEMPFHMNQINNALESCDLFVSIGTSGNVYPASGFYQTAKIRRAHTVELNLEETGSSFDAHVYGPATETVPQFFDQVLQQS